MNNFIKDISISNFKSLRDCKIEGCKRINLFIGRPNVGKSNILEALSAFSIPFLRETISKRISQLIRMESETEVFYNGNYNQPARIDTNRGMAHFTYDKEDGLLVKIDTVQEGGLYSIDDRLRVRFKRNDNYAPFIRKYSFSPSVKLRRFHTRYLIPPYGANIFSVIEKDEKLKEEISNLFAEYRLDLVFDRASQSLKILQSKEGKEIFLIPYNSIADTLQRIIFFKTAVASNSDCVLLFEEPEAHSFPPYMSHITQEMIHKVDNQYFVATHSPFILNDFLENARDELAVFMVHYENHETRLRKLSDSELHEIYQHGVDLFTNSESYLKSNRYQVNLQTLKAL